ncbi:MAG TPA: deoxynucleoside kinase [Bacteroidales bacterium]|nr:deoxynucleoside kinase [Bacteroidales bacterium]
MRKNNYPFVVIEGNIGAGKTTLASALAKQYNGNLLLEKFQDNPFLPLFYKNPDKYGFMVEINFLIERYKQLYDFQQLSLFRQFTIADFYFNKSLIFSTKTLDEKEYNLYKKIYHIINSKLPIPDLYIYLKQPVGKLLENIKKRGRPYEQDIDETYLKKIDTAYFDFFKTVKNFPVAIIDISQVDILKKDILQAFYHCIFNEKFKQGINYYNL